MNTWEKFERIIFILCALVLLGSMIPKACGEFKTCLKEKRPVDATE